MAEPKRRKPEVVQRRKPPSDLDRVLTEINNVEAAVWHVVTALEETNRLLAALVAANQPPVLGDLHARLGTPVSDLGDPTMPVNIPAPRELLDTEKQPMSIMPRKADFHIDAAVAGVNWVNSDDTNIGLEVGTEAFDFEDIKLAADGVTEEWREIVTCPGNFRAWALTPNASGAGATITVSATGYESATFGPFTYAAGVARSLNASFGDPVSDLV